MTNLEPRGFACQRSISKHDADLLSPCDLEAAFQAFRDELRAEMAPHLLAELLREPAEAHVEFDEGYDICSMAHRVVLSANWVGRLDKPLAKLHSMLMSKRRWSSRPTPGESHENSQESWHHPDGRVAENLGEIESQLHANQLAIT